MLKPDPPRSGQNHDLARARAHAALLRGRCGLVFIQFACSVSVNVHSFTRGIPATPRSLAATLTVAMIVTTMGLCMCALVVSPPRGRMNIVRPIQRCGTPLATIAVRPVLEELSAQLAAVRALRPSDQSPEVQMSLWRAAGLNPVYKVSGIISGEPSYTRLFDHKMWKQYTGRPPFRRWFAAIRTWRHSTILTALWPIMLAASAWAFLVASLPTRWLPRTAAGPHGLIGSAIGLLLVFRTNNTYQRLSEARLLWGRAVFLCREIAQNAATALLFDPDVPCPTEAKRAAADTCRYVYTSERIAC